MMGCHAKDAPTPPAAPVLGSLEAWAGSTATIHGAALAAGGDSAILHLSDTTLALTRQNDTTMSFAVPSTMGGQFFVHLDLNGESAYLGLLHVDGYADMQTYAPNIVYDAYPLRTGAHAVVIGGSSLFSGNVERVGFTLFDLDSRSLTTYDSVLEYGTLHGPGPTSDDSAFVLAGRDGLLRTWRLTAARSIVEVEPAYNAGPGLWQAMRLSSNAWITTGKRDAIITVRPDTAHPFVQVNDLSISEPQGVYLSPRRDRATITVAFAASGIPVFAASGDVAYSVAQLHNARAVDFSATGDALAIVGGASSNPSEPSRLLLLNATTGAVLRDTLLGSPAFAATFDRTRPVLYVGLTGIGGFPSVLVLDASSLAVLGTLSVPTTGMACEQQDCIHGVIALSASNALYVFWSYNGPTRAYRFTLPAAGGAARAVPR